MGTTNTATVIDITGRIALRQLEQLQALEELLPVPEAKAPLFVPAYAQADNERRGAKFDRALRTPQIAALVRADIKAALGVSIPRGTKVSVRSDSFSGGSAIRLSVTAVPASMTVCNPERVRREATDPHTYIDSHVCPYYTAEAVALLDAVTAICQAYNRDNSDISVDYFDVNFYDGRASFSHDVTRASKAAILASQAVAS